MSSPTWFITGCSSGFGYALASYALSQGHKVIATSRNPSKTPDLMKKLESTGRARWLSLDVTASPSEIKKTMQEAESIFGGLDILVNNAGYSILGAMEDIDEDAARKQWETNYWGPWRIIKAALPAMRARKSGTIVNVSSIAGLTVLPSCSIYAGSKFAIEALSESMSVELAPFNIRVLLVEPGVFRSKFFNADNSQFISPSEPYKDNAAAKSMQHMANLAGKQRGDPDKGARRIFEVVTGSGMGQGLTEHLRLPLGEDCLQRAREQIEKVGKNLDAMESIAKSTDADDHS